MPQRPLRILYAAGPGDVIGTFRHWKAGRDDPAQVAITYSGQFYSLCRELGAEGFIISYCPRKERLTDGNLTLEHRPTPFMKGPAPLYHLGQLWYGLWLTASALRFKADVAIISGGAHWFSLALLPWFGVKVAPTLHCVLWRKGRPPTGALGKTIQSLNAWFFRRKTVGALSISNDCTEQFSQLLANTPKRIFPFLPTYRPASFEAMRPAPPMPPFRVFFAGRIERNKGVFDLLGIATRFAAEGRRDIEFDLCGEGSALPELRTAVEQAGVAGNFRLHGHVNKPDMRAMYEQAHVVIVPTTRDFIEGFNKVVAEGVLAGKPVITSSVCPALEYVRQAVVEVPPDDAKAYGDAILRLRDDPAFYQSRIDGCATAQSQFYDPARGWAAAVKSLIASL